MDFEKERNSDTENVLKSIRKKSTVVVAGPGTGKSTLFKKVLDQEKKAGKTNFLAITFVGKLTDSLADDLAGLAETKTMHGFARDFVLKHCPKGWKYYPKIYEIIKEDLEIKGIKSFKIGDINYQERTKYYKTIGEKDVIHYAVEICKKDKNKIPKYDIILVDEFQDFNEIESSFIDFLSTQNKMLIVGDDDQSLYKELKDSLPKFIRDKFKEDNKDFESKILRFCSRCTNVIIESFHAIVNFFELDKGERIEKQYVCYLPEKTPDNDMNRKILVLKTIQGNIHFEIKKELEKILENQKIKTVLILGEGRLCHYLLAEVAQRLKDLGFSNINHESVNDKVFDFKESKINGYKYISEVSNNNLLLGWRLLIKDLKKERKNRIILENYNDQKSFIDSIPKKFKDCHEKNAKVLRKILDSNKSKREGIGESSINNLENQITIKENEKQRKKIFIDQLVNEHKNLKRPLNNLDITVCSILKAKGLSADVVFLIGFDEGKFPLKKEATRSEICQMLVSLTRARKRIYLVNSSTSKISSFFKCIKDYCQIV